MSSAPVSQKSITSILVQEIPVQELSIQWLSFNRVQKYTQIPTEKIYTTPLGKLVQRIIDVYNKSKAKESKKASKFQDLNIKDEFADTYQYQLKLYSKVEKRHTALNRKVKEMGVNPKKLAKNSSTEYIAFFFRDVPRREVVALTSRQAYKVVESCVDYKVPRIIAGRILDPHRISEITRRCLVGSDIQETIHNPSGREFYKTSNIYYLIESFKCKVKRESSLMALDFFKSKKQQKALPEITIRKGLVRVMKRIALENYPSLLDFFSKHIQAHRHPEELQSQTHNIQGKIEVSDRDFEFLHFLKAVRSKLKKDDLDQQAIEDIFDAYQKGQRQQFAFRHKYLQDFLESSTYEIQYAPEGVFKSLSSKPESIEDILELLSGYDKTLVSSSKQMQQAFQNVTFRFRRKDGSLISPDPLIEYIEGEIRDEEGNAYFKIRNMWYKLAINFQGLLHEDFRNLLKRTLIKPKEEGQLPNPWRGSKQKGQVSERLISEKFKINTKVRQFMGDLSQVKVCFVDKKDNVTHAKLVGEILQNKVIRKHQAVINQELLSKKRLPFKKKIKELFGKDADTIINQLKQERSLLTKTELTQGGNKKPVYVANPLFYPLKSNKFLKEKYNEFAAYLEKLHQEYAAGREVEEAYNRAYINTPGYLVFDQICPNNIEPCDILYYTKETVYLYHVKETLGQQTRDVCSQILNAAKEFRSALSTQHTDNFLQLLWKKGTGQLKEEEEESDKATSKKDTSWQDKVKSRLEEIGEEAFYSIFRDRRVVFVYAFLKYPQRSIHEEARETSYVSAKDLNLDTQPQVYQKLKDLQFLDSLGRLTGKFWASNQERFTKEDEEFSVELYQKMKRYAPASRSTLAKFELLDTERELRSLGFEFRICQIQRPQEDDIDDGEESNLPDPVSKPFLRQSSLEDEIDSKEEFTPSTLTPNIPIESFALDDDDSEEDTFPAYSFNSSSRTISKGPTSIKNSSSSVSSWTIDQPGLGFPNDGSSCFVNAAVQILLIDESTRRAVYRAALSWIEQFQTWSKFLTNPDEDLTDQEIIRLASLLIRERLGVLRDVVAQIAKSSSFTTQSDAIQRLITYGEEPLEEELSLENAKTIVDLMKEAHPSSEKIFQAVSIDEKLNALKTLISVIGYRQIWEQVIEPLRQFDILILILERLNPKDSQNPNSNPELMQEANLIWEQIKGRLISINQNLIPILEKIELRHPAHSTWKQLKEKINTDVQIDENSPLSLVLATSQKEKLEAILNNIASQTTQLTELRSLMLPADQKGQQEAGQLHAALINLLPPKERRQFGVLVSLSKQYVEVPETSLPEDFDLEASINEVEAYGSMGRNKDDMWKEIQEWPANNLGKSVCAYLLVEYLKSLKSNDTLEPQFKKEVVRKSVQEAIEALKKISEDMDVDEVLHLTNRIQLDLTQYKGKEVAKETPETQEAFAKLKNHYRLWRRRIKEEEGVSQDVSIIPENNTLTLKEECSPEILLQPSIEFGTYLDHGFDGESDDSTVYRKADGTLAMFRQIREKPLLSDSQETNYFAIRLKRNQGRPEKDQTDVHMPFERTFQGKTYELYAVAQHLSIYTNSGHYTALVKKGDKWWLFNDENCKKATEIDLANIGVKGSSFYYRLKA